MSKERQTWVNVHVNGEGAISRFRAHKGAIDLALLDAGLPDMHPVELMTYLHLLCNDLRLCLMARKPSLDYLSAGATWVFPKPFPQMMSDSFREPSRIYKYQGRAMLVY